MEVSILGCGWVGKALRDALRKKDFKVNCLSKSIKKNLANNLYNCSSLVVALPPSTKDYLNIIKLTFENLDNTNLAQVIFLSSISFYKSKDLVIKGEELIKKLSKDVVILRLGGLMGYDRVAGKYSQNSVVTNSSTNYIYKDDVVSIIAKIVELKIKNRIYDVVAPIQSTKKIIYKQNAKKFGFKEPHFNSYFEEGLNLNPNRLCKELNYTFKKSSVLDFWN
jgi:nucleoside-diphosphate-sugar epimerase